MGEETLSFRAFCDLIESALSEHELGIIPPAGDAVMVGTLRRSKLSHPRALFVLGMNDGRFPADTTDEVIFMAEELADLERQGLPPLMSVHLREEKDRIKIYELFTAPTEALVLSYPESDEEGKILKPALLTERLRQMLPDRFSTSPERDPYALAGSVEDRMLADLRWSLDRGRVDERALAALAYFEREAPDKAAWYREALLYDNRAGDLQPETVEKLYGGGPTLSVSALETFRQCPFRYTLQYGLRPRPRDTYEVNAMDIGTLFHGVVEQLIDRMRATGLPLDDLTADHMDRLVDEIVTETAATTKKRGIFEETARNAHLLEKVRRVARRSAKVILYQVQRGDFEPRAFELAFGDREQIPPMLFELPDGRFLKLRGVIDRVDLYERDGKTYVEIIDYKSGKKAFDLSEVYHGLQLQLLVYLRALLYNPQLFDAGGLEPAAVFYFRIDDPLVDPQESEEALAEALLRALSLDGLMVGDVSLVTAMDRDIAVKHDSPLIPAKLKKDGDFNAHSKVLAEPAFFHLLDHVERTVKGIGTRILAGEAAIRPVNHGSFEACRFCDFGHICQFDRRFNGNEPERLQRLKKDVVIEALEKEETTHA
jgi:ATP-dependent helicase/nuclease subunit B